MSDTDAGPLLAELLGPHQVASLLNVPVSWVYSAAERG
jgi:hypothetical protein